MPGVLRLNIKEANDLADHIENHGGSAESLRTAISDVTKQSIGLKTIVASEMTDEEQVESLRNQSTVKYGNDLECMVCHAKVDSLVSGTCENCFREWALTTKRR